MKKINLVLIGVLILILSVAATSCIFKKKPEKQLSKSPIEQVALMCYVEGVKNKTAHWIFTTRTPLECPNWSDLFIVEDSINFLILQRLNFTGIVKAQMDVSSSTDQLYIEKGTDMKMTKINEVYVSYGHQTVVRYRLLKNKLYVKKYTADELIDTFPKNIRDVLSSLGIYILNK